MHGSGCALPCLGVYVCVRSCHPGYVPTVLGVSVWVHMCRGEEEAYFVRNSGAAALREAVRVSAGSSEHLC